MYGFTALHRSAAVQAEAAGKSLNQFIQEAIEEKLSPDPKPVVIMIDRQGTLVPTSDPSFPGLIRSAGISHPFHYR